MKPYLLIFVIIFVSLPIYNLAHDKSPPPKDPPKVPKAPKAPKSLDGEFDIPKKPFPTKERDIDVSTLKSNETIMQVSKQLCKNCSPESLSFVYEHNLVRAKKGLQPLIWDRRVRRYAKWYARKRKVDCNLVHSKPPDAFPVGENIFWGGGNAWTPNNAVTFWASEEKDYSYEKNDCKPGEMCGHYTQIVSRPTRRLGCARTQCNSGDIFITCNYYPSGNMIGEKPY